MAARHVDILLRTCDNVPCHSGGQRLVDVPRIELTLRSISSLLDSIREHTDNSHDVVDLIIVDDSSSRESLAQMFSLVDSRGMVATHVPVIGRGNGDSIKTHYEWARDNSEDLIYFLEDDYMHDINMVREMIEFFKDCEGRPGMEELVLHPCDYPDRYHRELYKSWILLGKYRHWRSILHTTSTSMIRIDTLIKHWDDYMIFTRYGKDPKVTEDNSINKIYRTVPCFSPMPTLSTHLQYPATLSPYTDWKPLWAEHALGGE